MRRALLLAAALVLALAPGVRAQGDSIVIRSYDTDLVVNREGYVDVTETIRFAFFGPWNGILRDISLEHRNGQGRREKLRVEVQGVTAPGGEAYRYELESGDDSWTRRVRIFVPGAHDAERTVVVRYRVANALRFFQPGSPVSELDELYWNVTGNAWTMPIERVRARIILPDGVRPTQWAAYTGFAGSTGRDADVESSSGIVTATTRRRLEAGEGLTVAAGWPPGAILGRPSAAAVRRAETLRWWPAGLPFLAFAFMLRTWRRRGKDPEAQAVVVGYEPPEGMSPAELGTLVDHRADMPDVIATLVDLAVRGHVGIEEREEKKLLGLFKDIDYVFHRRTSRAEWESLRPHEQAFLRALFSSAHQGGAAGWSELKEVFVEARRARAEGREDFDPRAYAEQRRAATETRTTETEWVRLDDLKNSFYRSIPGIKDAIYDRLKENGYYTHRPDRAVALWMVLAVFMAFAAVFGTVMASESGLGWVNPLAWGAGMGVSAIFVFGFGLAMPARTEKGARTREAALGFREFLEKVESDRYRRMITGPEMFERYLPYAMAFGVEGRWAAAFEDLYREPPDWYSGSNYGGHFHAGSFTSRMSAMSSTAGSTMSSSPSSSGSGGGGSSGGGSGGGGGSGF